MAVQDEIQNLKQQQAETSLPLGEMKSLSLGANSSIAEEGEVDG